jgi:hypothetical protein
MRTKVERETRKLEEVSHAFEDVEIGNAIEGPFFDQIVSDAGLGTTVTHLPAAERITRSSVWPSRRVKTG